MNVSKAPHDVKIIPNQWNTIEATVDKDHFVVVFNGKKVADGHDARRASGHIGLQLAHPEDVRHANLEFRNLKVRRLPYTSQSRRSATIVLFHSRRFHASFRRRRHLCPARYPAFAQRGTPPPPTDRTKASYMSAQEVADAIAKLPKDRANSSVRVFTLPPYNVNIEHRQPMAQGASVHAGHV